MHNNFEELIPYYIAGTLPRTEVTRLENHLAGCADCRKSLIEWRAIASVVRAEAASQLRDLPPLSARVLSAAAQETGSRRYASQSPLTIMPTRDRATAITLIAAVFTVIFFGGLLAFMVLRGNRLQTAAQVVEVVTATPTPFPTLTLTPQPQIIVIEPSITPTPLATLVVPSPMPVIPTRIPPTRIVPTRRPPTSAPPPTEVSGQAQMSLLNPQTCALHVAVPNGVVNLYAGPGMDYAVLRTLSSDDEVIALGKTDTGWFNAQYEPNDAQLVGWVQQALVYTSGSCETLPLIPLLAPTETVLPFMPTLTPSPEGMPGS